MSHPVDAKLSILHPQVADYLERLTPAPDPLLDRMERLAEAQGFPLVGRQAGRWLELLARMVGARWVLELGSGWGYSACWLARAVGDEGLVVGTEVDAGRIEQHRSLFEGHPLAGRIRLRHGDALAILDEVPGPFDLVFIDVEKEDYLRAARAAIPKIRPGGLLVADNVLWGGKVTGQGTDDDAATEALRHFNRELLADPRLDAALLPADDGLLVARVR